MSQKWREHTQYVKGSLFSLPSLSATCFLTLSTGIKENHVIIFSDNYQKGKLHVNSQQLRNTAAALYTSIQCGRPIMLYFLGSLLAFIFYFFLFFKYKKKKSLWRDTLCVVGVSPWDEACNYTSKETELSSANTARVSTWQRTLVMCDNLLRVRAGCHEVWSALSSVLTSASTKLLRL